MLGKTSQLGLSRRVIAYYLMFGMGAVTWLGIGAVVVATSILESRAETKSLNRLGQAASAVRGAAVRDETTVQPLVEQLRRKWGLDYCAVMSGEGRYVAHSSRGQIGQQHIPPTGEVACWGDVQRTCYLNASSQRIRQYQTPISRRGQVWGTLLVASRDPGVWGAVLAASEHAPAALLCPLLLMVIGAITLRRTLRPVTAIEEQLQRAAVAPSLSGEDLRPVRTPSPVGVGWDRLVESFRNHSRRADFNTRLNQALEGYRQKKLEQILNSLSDGVAVTDGDGAVTFANKALVALLGMAASEEAMYGETMEECLALESLGTQARQLRDPGFRGRTVVVEMWRSGDMSQGVLRIARSPLCPAEGDAGEGHVWSIRDVTQQKLADQMRDQFVNAATHELRTPLANIKAYAETLSLSEMMDVEQQKSFCNTIDEEVTRLALFVDDLLQLSRMEVGSTSLNRQVTDMDRLVRETIDKVRPQMKRKNITFEAKMPGKLPELVVDKDKLTVALVNLLGNAAKYTPENGRVELHVEVTEKTVRIDVEDTGMGISVEELPKVFDKFFRSSDPRVHEQTGSGLGLSLANEIVRLHGGKLTVHSELNKGSKFTIILPMLLEEARCLNG
jgi:PAS domain S-box-containing protein